MTLVEHIDPALDAGERLDAFAFEPDEDTRGVLVGAAADLGCLVVRPVEDLGGALLSELDELALLQQLRGLALGTRGDLVGLLARSLGDAAHLLGDALGLAHLVGYRDPQLVDELEHSRLVEDDVVRQGKLLAGRHE